MTTPESIRSLDLSGIRISGKSLGQAPLGALDRLTLLGQHEDVEGAVRAIGELPEVSYVAWPSDPRRLTVGRFVRSAGPSPVGRHVTVEAACVHFGFPLARSRRSRLVALTAEARARLLCAVALAGDGQWILLDDPFQGITGGVRAGLRGRLLDAVSAFGRGLILAGASALDAAVVGGGAITLEKGQIADVAPLETQLREPRSNLAAGLTGVNVFSGLARRNWLSIGHSRVRARTLLDGKVYVTIPTDAARLSFDEFDPAFTSESVFEALVVGIRDKGNRVQVVLSPADPEVGLAMSADLFDFTPASRSAEDAEWGILHPGLGASVSEQVPRVRVGARVFVDVDTSRMSAYPADAGALST